MDKVTKENCYNTAIGEGDKHVVVGELGEHVVDFEQVIIICYHSFYLLLVLCM